MMVDFNGRLETREKSVECLQEKQKIKIKITVICQVDLITGVMVGLLIWKVQFTINIKFISKNIITKITIKSELSGSNTQKTINF